MVGTQEAAKFGFGRFRLDLQARKLWDGQTSIVLKNKAFDILSTLAAARGEVVTKDQIMAEVWPGIVVDESNIQVHISAIRKALGEETGRPVHLFTVPGRGYRLAGVDGPASEIGDERLIPDPSATDDRPTIAVLPFDNLGSDTGQDYFADGMVEDIITGLSRIKWLSVIARNSSFFYKGKQFDVRQVGHDLGVRYVLQGSVRKFGDRLRINVQLVEAQTGRQLWTERYDRLLGDVFEVQDEIAMSVVGVIEPGLRKIEFERVKRKRPDSLDAYDLVLRALPSIYKLMPEGSAPAIPLLQKALQLEPDYPFAHAALAWCFHIRFSRGGLNEEDRASSIRHARAAVAGASDDATTLAIAAFVIWFDEHDLTTAFDLFDRALSISNSNLIALSTSAVALAWSGRSELAIERAKRALKLSPFDSLSYLAYQGLAGANFNLRSYAEAYEAARRAVEAIPTFSVPYAYLAAALVRLGRNDDARIAAGSLLRLEPRFTIGRFSTVVGVNEDVIAGFVAAWREAGLPD